MRKPRFTITLDSSAPRLNDVQGFALGAMRKHDAGETQRHPLHPADYELFPAQVTNRVSIVTK